MNANLFRCGRCGLEIRESDINRFIREVEGHLRFHPVRGSAAPSPEDRTPGATA